MYGKIAMDHFLHPRHAGVLQGAGVGRGEATNADCGDTATVTVRADNGRIAEARFASTGCAGAIAACSAVAEWLVGKAVIEAVGVDAAVVDGHLGGLPEAKQACADMAARAAAAAVRALP